MSIRFCTMIASLTDLPVALCLRRTETAPPVVFLDFRFYRLEHVIVGARQCAPGHGNRNGDASQQDFPNHF